MDCYLHSQFGPGAEPWAALVAEGASQNMTDEDFLVTEIMNWQDSPARRTQLTGERYYRGDHDILRRRREAIGPGGRLFGVDNLPNSHIVDNQYAKMVDQKVDYLLGKPFSFKTDDEAYLAALNKVFDKGVRRLFHDIAADCLNGGIAWLHPYYDEAGDLKFQRFPPSEILPFWKDAAHAELDLAIRLYATVVYEGRRETLVQRVEVYSARGVARYILSGGRLLPDEGRPSSAHAAVVTAAGARPLNWARTPLIAFKYNAKEIPLIEMVKSLQDGINLIRSDWQNRMQEDAHNTILVLKNYDGEDLGEFRWNLARYGAVKIRSMEGAEGGLETLRVEIDAENFELILKSLKRALTENARGFDAKDDRLGGNPNEMNLKSMYSDIDLDADGMETQFQASFDQMLWFIDRHLYNTGAGDFTARQVTVTFSRNMIVNESQIIADIKNSVGILSDETLTAQHPYVADPQAELERKKREKQAAEAEEDPYKDVWPAGQGKGGAIDEA